MYPGPHLTEVVALSCWCESTVYPASSLPKLCLFLPRLRHFLQVKELITAADANGQNIFHWAASVGCKDTFAAVLEALGNRLTHEEVRAARPALEEFQVLLLDTVVYADVPTQYPRFIRAWVCNAVALPRQTCLRSDERTRSSYIYPLRNPTG